MEEPQFTGTLSGAKVFCEYCGTLHAGTCWRVKAIEYYDNGAIKRVELIADTRDYSMDKPTDFWPTLNAGRYSQEPA